MKDCKECRRQYEIEPPEGWRAKYPEIVGLCPDCVVKWIDQNQNIGGAP
jgi:hypothetical protein